MRFSFLHRSKAVAAVAVCASAIALAGTVPAAASVTRQAPQARPAWNGPVVLVTCKFHGQVMPRKFVLSCGDGNDFLTGLRWVSWRHVAFGSGVEHLNNCIPSCGAGHFRRFHVLVNLWRAKKRGHLDQWKFTRLTVVYTRHHPTRFNAHGKKRHPQTWTFHV
ncbi:MAG TPA: hypothetical protein VFV41_27250 [Streptosporangiaceae bacterium]|nr:hypothetical protein [Streptosporangiaceae bacterium]